MMQMAVTVHAHLIVMQHVLENVQVVQMVAKVVLVDAKVDAKVDARPIVGAIAKVTVTPHVCIRALVAANKDG